MLNGDKPLMTTFEILGLSMMISLENLANLKGKDPQESRLCKNLRVSGKVLTSLLVLSKFQMHKYLGIKILEDLESLKTCLEYLLAWDKN